MSDDWINLAHELGFQSTDIAQIQKEYPDSSGQQCMSMLNLWMNETSGQDSGTTIIYYVIFEPFKFKIVYYSIIGLIFIEKYIYKYND